MRSEAPSAYVITGRLSLKPARAHVGSTALCTPDAQGALCGCAADGPANAHAPSTTAARIATFMPPLHRVGRRGSIPPIMPPPRIGRDQLNTFPGTISKMIERRSNVRKPLLVPRRGHGEPRVGAPAVAVRDMRFAAVGLGDRPHDGEPQAGALAGAGLVGAGEAL